MQKIYDISKIYSGNYLFVYRNCHTKFEGYVFGYVFKCLPNVRPCQVGIRSVGFSLRRDKNNNCIVVPIFIRW